MATSDITVTPGDPLDLPGEGRWYRVNGLENDLDVRVLVERDSADNPLIKHVQIAGRTVLAEHLRTIPLRLIERVLRHDIAVLGFSQSGEFELRAPGKLTRRMDGEDDAAFADRVARTYRWYAGRTIAPAKAIAEESGLPVGTVRRWIKEARQAGAIRPGRRGRAG